MFAPRWRLGLNLTKICLVFGFLFLGAGCATYEKEGGGSPLVRAERRLGRAERNKLNTEGQAAEYLAVVKIASGELAKDRSTTAPAEPGQAMALYNRAVADLATDLPALIRQENNSKVLTLRDRQTGEYSQLQIESAEPGEYPPAYFREILRADAVNKKGLTDDVTRPGLGGNVVGVHQSSPPGVPAPRFEPLKGFRISLTAVWRNVVNSLEADPRSAGSTSFGPFRIRQAILLPTRHCYCGTIWPTRRRNMGPRAG